jgi:hypothetical protein
MTTSRCASYSQRRSKRVAATSSRGGQRRRKRGPLRAVGSHLVLWIVFSLYLRRRHMMFRVELPPRRGGAMAEDADRIARIARRLATLREDEIENDPEFLALSNADREAVARSAAQGTAHALETAAADSEMAESFGSAADADLIEVLTRGSDVIHALGRSTQPVALLAWIEQIAKQDQDEVVAALFAAVLDHVCQRDDAPPALKELDAQWFARTARGLEDEAEAGG